MVILSMCFLRVLMISFHPYELRNIWFMAFLPSLSHLLYGYPRQQTSYALKQHSTLYLVRKLYFPNTYPFMVMVFFPLQWICEGTSSSLLYLAYGLGFQEWRYLKLLGIGFPYPSHLSFFPCVLVEAFVSVSFIGLQIPLLKVLIEVYCYGYDQNSWVLVYLLCCKVILLQSFLPTVYLFNGAYLWSFLIQSLMCKLWFLPYLLTTLDYVPLGCARDNPWCKDYHLLSLIYLKV